MVAIKVLNLDTAEDEIKDVQQEIALLSQLALADAQNVTKYHGSFLNGSKLWIIMDYCSGGSVRTLLKAGKIEEKYSAVIVRELLVALQYIHKEGIIHRDIKAANVLVTKEGRVQLCDFGVAAQLSSVQLKRTSMIGTPFWMAPEVIQEGTPYNQKADVWSLGITLYEIATGTPPLSDQEPKRAVYLIPRSKPARLEGTQYSPALKEFVAKCLDEQPEERATAEELSKTRFIKATRNVPTFIIRDLIVRYNQWRENNKGVRDSFLLPNNGGAEIYSDDDEDNDNPDAPDFWDFGDSPHDPDTLPMPAPFADNTILKPQYSGSRMGTLMPGTEVNSEYSTANFTDTGVHDNLTSQIPTYRIPEKNEEEKHPLMELFEAESPDPLPPLLTMSSTNPSSVNLSGIAPMQDYASPMISLDLPPTGQPYTPVEIEIPSFDALDSRRNIAPGPQLLSLAGQPVSSASTPNLPDLTNSKQRMGSITTGSAISPIVTPHTPIKPVFSQTNLSMYNNNMASPMTSNVPSTSIQHQKLTPHNTTKPSIGRTPSPKRGVKPKLSPKSFTSHQPLKSLNTPISSQTPSQRTASSQSSMDSTTDVEDLHGSFDFSNASLMHDKPRTLSRSESSTSLKEQHLAHDVNSKRQNLFLAMPPPTFGQSGAPQQPALQSMPSFSGAYNGSMNPGIGSAHSTNSLDQTSLSQQQILYKQQLLQQQQKQGPVALSQLAPPPAASERAPRLLTTQRQYMQKQIKKTKQQKELKQLEQRPHRQGSSISGASPISMGPRRFPKLVELDSNALLDATPKDESVAHFDTLLASFISSLDAIEQDLSMNYLSSV